MNKDIALPFIGNPLDALNDAVRAFVNMLLELFGAALATPLRPQDGSWFTDLFGQAYGLSLAIALPVSVLVIVTVMFVKRRFASVAHALIVVIGLTVLGGSWLAICNQLMGFGDTLAQVAGFIPTPSNSKPGVFSVPVIDAVFGSILSMMVIIGMGVLLMSIIFFYSMLNYVVMLFVPLAFAISPLGKRSQAILEWLLSIGLVGMVFGRAAARACITLGQLAINNLPLGTTWFGQTFYIFAAFTVAIVLQITLVFTVHRGVKKVAGKVLGSVSSRVRGHVETSSKKRQPVDVKSASANHLSGINPVRGSRTREATRQAAGAGRDYAVRQGTVALIKRYGGTAAAAHPAGRAALIGVAAVNRRHGGSSRPPRKPSESSPSAGTGRSTPPGRSTRTPTPPPPTEPTRSRQTAEAPKVDSSRQWDDVPPPPPPPRREK